MHFYAKFREEMPLFWHDTDILEHAIGLQAYRTFVPWKKPNYI